jgi:hypothetical protein
MEETDTDKETLGIYVSAGRFKAIVDMMDSDITIASDGEKMSIISAIGKQFIGLIYILLIRALSFLRVYGVPYHCRISRGC